MTSPLSSSTGLIESNVAANQFNSMDSIALITKQLVARAKEERAEDNRVYGAFYNGVLTSEELEGLRRAFQFYVKFPEERWDEVKTAEHNEEAFATLHEEFMSLDMLHREKRVRSDKVEASEVFIND